MWEEGYRLFSYDTRIDAWAFWILLCGSIITFIGYCVLWSPKKHLRDFLSFLLTEYAVVVLLVTVLLRKTLAVPGGYEQSLFGNKSALIENSFIEFLFNILLFVPIGFLLYAILRRHRVILTLLLGMAFSFLIEMLQFAFQKGLVDINDVICNNIGLVIGIGCNVAVCYAIMYFRLCKSVYNNNK